VTRDSGIKIHRISCPNASRLIEMYPYRIQKVKWAESPSSGSFQSTIRVVTDLEPHVINQIMDIVGTFKASLRAFNVTENNRTGTYDITMKVSVPSTMELDKVTSMIRNLRSTHKVTRQ
jgi:GTP pyrophosphokinase